MEIASKMEKSKYKSIESHARFKDGVNRSPQGLTAKHAVAHRISTTPNATARIYIMAILSIILGAILFLSSPCHQYAIVPQNLAGLDTDSEPPPLTFKRDGTFQISIFSDLHFGENAWTKWGSLQDIHSVRVLNSILDSEPSVDLVVLNGDLITGENTFVENSTHYLDQIVQPMVEHNLTWASTYGNHDSSFNLSRDALFARETTQWPRYSRTRAMVEGDVGVTNYYLPVYNKPECATATDNSLECTPALILWFFDSRGGHLFQQTKPNSTEWVGQPDWVDSSVVEWFQTTNAALQAKSGKIIPSLAFVHIPVNASLTLQQGGIDPAREPGIDQDYPVSQQGQGWCADGRNDGSCAYGGQDVPFMKALVQTEGLVALFSGHDHGNTWCGVWDGSLTTGNGKENATGRKLNLCFGQHSGYGGYGHWIRGGRQLVVSLEGLSKAGEDGEDYEVETWIRLEDGGVVGAVTLNSTYGQDVYPVTPDQRTKCPDCEVD